MALEDGGVTGENRLVIVMVRMEAFGTEVEAPSSLAAQVGEGSIVMGGFMMVHERFSPCCRCVDVASPC